MIDRIYKALTADVQWQNDPDQPDYNPLPPQTVLIAESDTESAFLVGQAGFSDWDALGTLVGSWDAYNGLQEGQSYDVDGVTVIGTPTHPVTADYTGWIRPLGNESGKATGILDATRWAGHAEPKFLQDDNRYPDTESPFQLKIERVDHTADPSFPGWGWKVTMLSDDPLRDITARAVGIYSDEECTLYLYTTGAFVDDGDGTFYTECPAGQRTTNPEPVYFALLLGSAQEGYFTLPEGSSVTEALFWSKDQGASDEPEPWVQPTGAHDAYQIGDLVTHNGSTWESTAANNVWEPGVFGWIQI